MTKIKTVHRKHTLKSSKTKVRNSLQRGVFAFQDILDQPQAPYFLVVEPSPIHPQTFLVDRVNVTEHQIQGVLKGSVVTAFSPMIPWYSVASKYVEMITTEEMATRTAEDDKRMGELRKKLYPKSKDHDHNHDHEDDSDRPTIHTGQYA